MISLDPTVLNQFNVFKKNRINTVITAVFTASLIPSINAADTIAPEISEEDVPKVVITGSRLARDPNLASTSPVQSLDATAIKQSGEISIADVVNDIPALFSSVTAEGSKNNGADLSDGANVLNLRGLGTNRTLVLVNGRRHVAGVTGQAAVDVGSIPVKLLDRVEVLSGGASAIYGADAVTGVVNFILNKNFEGFEVDFQSGISKESDARQDALSLVWGSNFDSAKGNIAVAIDYTKDQGLRAYERKNGRLIGSAQDWVNPALRFQQGDISEQATPNFARYFNYAQTGLFNFGLEIPKAEDFIADYLTQFGTTPTLTEQELALIARAANAPQRIILPERTFPFTSGYGYIIPGNPFTGDGFDPLTNIDLDGNGRPDCLDSFTGYNSVYGKASYGIVGGCWNVTADGSYRPIHDGLIANDFQGFGGDSFNTLVQDDEYIILPQENISLNLIANYDLTSNTTAFAEIKYVTQKSKNESNPKSFWDLLLGAPDNPYLPTFIQPVATQYGGVAITMDPIFIGNSEQTTNRDTARVVAGLQGSFDNSWQFEMSLNWGQYEETIHQKNSIINDRFFAAIDAVIDPLTGNPACRVEVDPNAAPMTTPFDIPVYDPGYFSFTPGNGECVPMNIWAGHRGITQEAIDWVTTDSNTKSKLEQLVFSGYIAGDSTDYFELPAGPLSFVIGTELRKEKSAATFDALQRGIIPSGSPFPAGTHISEHSNNESLVFRPALRINNEQGDYSVKEVFMESAIPLLLGEQWAEELTLELAVRFADYTTVGSATTWKANLFYQPYNDLTLRATTSVAVRAPNITELFGPEVGTTFRPNDPCDIAQITAMAENNQALAQQTQANCESYFASINFSPNDDSGNYNFADPLSAAFGGVQRGNAELIEETADTNTFGLIYQPDYLQGFALSIDYWQIEIEDAIQEVDDQDIVNSCFIGPELNIAFCELLNRSTQNGGFNFIESTLINFAKLETSGFDFSIGYQFNYEEHQFSTKFQGTKVHKLNQFTNPNDLTVVNPELKEVNRPELAGNLYLNWEWNNLKVGTQSQYMSEQLLGYVEIEQQYLYGDVVMQDEQWIHHLNAAYQFTEEMAVYGGIKNLTDEKPFMTAYSFPVSARGRFFYFGIDYKM
ncbi:TonB-dependent receptor domain-containing protein [Aliikangiella maris]|uniref:TonB-dependent receptor n=2 Tax=Aliikangiella maris TaxID=3162458 RepID=A0ABV3MJY2_9GAMM